MATREATPSAADDFLSCSDAVHVRRQLPEKFQLRKRSATIIIDGCRRRFDRIIVCSISYYEQKKKNNNNKNTKHIVINPSVRSGARVSHRIVILFRRICADIRKDVVCKYTHRFVYSIQTDFYRNNSTYTRIIAVI